MPTLYEELLGERYSQLHPILKAFHSQPGGGIADCCLEVIHPPGMLKSLFRFFAGVPDAGTHEKTLLEVVVSPQGETWRRTMGGKTMVTRQWSRGGLLIEAIGPGAFGIVLSCEQGGMKFETRRFWLLGIPVFRAISPSVYALVTPRAASWEVEVRLAAPLVGTILVYQGEVTPR